MKPDQQTERELNETFDKIVEAYSQGRVDDAMQYIAQEDDITFIEPGPGQVYVGPAEVRRAMQWDYETTEGDMPVEIRRRWLSQHGDVAWLTAETAINVTVKGQGPLNLEGRVTGVAKRVDGRWLWHSVHIAEPEPFQAPNQAWPTQQPQTAAAR